MQRRKFIKLGTGLTLMSLLPIAKILNAKTKTSNIDVKNIEAVASNVTRHWLGKNYWGNRLQDWRVNGGKIECLQGGKGYEVRTFSLLSRFLNNTEGKARLTATVGNLTPNKQGFCGFLLGAGAGELNYKSAALTQRASGTNGGFMAVVDNNGQLSFRDFSDTDTTFDFKQLTQSKIQQQKKFNARAIVLDCQIEPTLNGKFEVHLLAYDKASNKQLGHIVRTNVAAKELQGGILMVSSPPTNQQGARWWFNDIKTGGEKITETASHTLGPVVGCMHSLNKNILKLTAQLMPVGANEYQQLRFDYKQVSTDQWIKGPISNIEDGFMHAFRISNWLYNENFNYRVVDPINDDEALYSGNILKDPGGDRALKIALMSCLTPTAKSLDDGVYTRRIKEERVIGRWTNDNILFPFESLVKNCAAQQPDLYVFCGDQFYEGVPTRIRRNKPDSKLDLLYRWYLWYWSFKESLRSRPAIVLADDHDVLQGNLWGVSGRDPLILEGDKRTEEDGGYTQDKSLVRMVYRLEHGHNPDAYDPTPIAHNISVTYGAFVYGGTSFAIIEDRKFKSRRNTKIDPRHTQGELLGHRQEHFLSAWKDMDQGLPKICITASMWGSPQTKGNVTPLLDYDSNGYPPDGRTRAVQLIKDANAVVIAGDQHLAMIAKQGVNRFDDGPTFFAGPAGAAFWQRWFEGEGQLNNKRNNDPNTGDFTDTFGNKMRVLAVANPKVRYSVFKEQVGDSWSNFLSDRNIKSEGYGIVNVDHQSQQFCFECWPYDANPSKDKQFEGWPYCQTFTKED